MRRIVLDMRSGIFSDAIMRTLKESDPDFVVYRSVKPDETAALCRASHANVLVMEVVRQDPWKLSERIAVRNEVKNILPGCKILLLVDECVDELLATDVRQAVKDGLADNFIYASVSPTYLVAVIDTL